MYLHTLVCVSSKSFSSLLPFDLKGLLVILPTKQDSHCEKRTSLSVLKSSSFVSLVILSLVKRSKPLYAKGMP